jgi:hypothetical protein
MKLAADDDYWIRHILEKGLVKSTGINAAKLAGLFDPVAQGESKPWVQEISGRALSLAKDIRDFAQRRAAPHAPSLKFRQLLDAPVVGVRKIQYCDVWLTPNDEDPAHADLTYNGPLVTDNTMGSDTIPQDILLLIATDLLNILAISNPDLPDGLARVEALRPGGR